MMAGVVLTALYMTRQMIYVFFGQRREAAEHAHESPRVMTAPLIVLAILHGRSQRRAHAGLAVAARLSQRRAVPRLRSRAIDSADAFRFARAGRGRNRSGHSDLSQSRDESDPLQRAQPALFRFLENRDVAR